MKSSPGGRRRLRFLVAISASVFLFAGLGVVALTFGAQSASAANLSISQCNAVGNTPVNCVVNVVNTLTDDPGTTGSVVTINGVVSSSGNLVTSVTQCDGSSNGGGAGVTCSVNIVNNIAMNAPSASTGATVDQCVGSGFPIGLATCNPYPAATSGATITQCNGSGNGGTLVAAFTFCNASGTVSASLPVTVDQCNGSANGGGNIVACSTSITTNVVDTSTTTTAPVVSPGSGAGSGSVSGSGSGSDSGSGSLTGVNGSVAKFTG